jgi:hypothetical protein
MVELTAPHLPGQNEAAQLHVTTGRMPRGAELALLTEQGEILGSVAPFGPRLGGGSITGTVPIPRSEIIDGRLRLKLEVLEPGASPRAPRPGEVENLEIILVPQPE